MDLPLAFHPVCRTCHRWIMWAIAPNVATQVRGLLGPECEGGGTINAAAMRELFDDYENEVQLQPAEVRHAPLDFLGHTKIPLAGWPPGPGAENYHLMCRVEVVSFGRAFAPIIGPILREWSLLGDHCNREAVTDEWVGLFIAAEILNYYASDVRPRPPGYDAMHGDNAESGLNLDGPPWTV